MKYEYAYVSEPTLKQMIDSMNTFGLTGYLFSEYDIESHEDDIFYIAVGRRETLTAAKQNPLATLMGKETEEDETAPTINHELAAQYKDTFYNSVGKIHETAPGFEYAQSVLNRKDAILQMAKSIQTPEQLSKLVAEFVRLDIYRTTMDFVSKSKPYEIADWLVKKAETEEKG